MKKILLLMTIIASLLFLAGCSDTSVNEVPDEPSTGVADISPKVPDVEVEDMSVPEKMGDDERSRYIQANVEISCYTMTSGQMGSLDDEEDAYDVIVQKYGFSSLEELESLSSKYSNLQTEVGQGMMEECPEVMEAINQLADEFPSDPSASTDINDWK